MKLKQAQTPAVIARAAGLATFKEAVDYLSSSRRNLERLCKRDQDHFRCLMKGVRVELSEQALADFSEGPFTAPGNNDHEVAINIQAPRGKHDPKGVKSCQD